MPWHHILWRQEEAFNARDPPERGQYSNPPGGDALEDEFPLKTGRPLNWVKHVQMGNHGKPGKLWIGEATSPTFPLSDETSATWGGKMITTPLRHFKATFQGGPYQNDPKCKIHFLGHPLKCKIGRWTSPRCRFCGEGLQNTFKM